MFARVLSTLAASLAVANACYTAASGPPGSDNPTSAPGLGAQVVAGTPFTISWTPTSNQKVCIVLLSGPSSNVVPIGTIVDSTDNTGSFTWVPSTSLDSATTGYGIQIIQADGAYQYSPQFGVSNPNKQNVVVVTSSVAPSSSVVVPTSSAPQTQTSAVSSSSSKSSITSSMSSSKSSSSSLSSTKTNSSTASVKANTTSTMHLSTLSIASTTIGSGPTSSAGAAQLVAGLGGAAGMMAALAFGL